MDEGNLQAADSAKLMTINVWLGGRSYRISIPTPQEAAIRHSIKAADQKITELRQHYAGKDDQDFVAMALLMYATAEGQETPGMLDEHVDALVKKIDKVLLREE